MAFALVAVTSWLAGQLKVCKQQLTESSDALVESRLEIKGYLNRLLEKQGVPVVFDDDGNIITATPSMMSGEQAPPSFIRPPFAAAEARWEEEYEADHAVPIFNPSMSQAEKAAMLSQYIKPD